MNIIVTGAGKGVGREVVIALSKQKSNHIIAISRNGKALESLVRECSVSHPGSQVMPYEFDLQQFDFYPFIVQRLGTLIPHCDVVVHNAGKLINKPFEKLAPSDFDDIYNVNVRAPFFFTQALLPMMSKGSHIVNIGSMGGVPGTKKYRGLSAYSSSKGALHVLTEMLAEELAPKEISVNCLALGSVQTEMFNAAFPGVKAALSPAQMGRFIADFAVTGHRYFNGKILPVAVSTP